MKYVAYWVSPYGDVMPLTSDKHINEVWENPDKFGTSEEELKSIFKKHKEKRGSEGNAREEVMANLMKKGWTRARYISNSNAFVVQVFKLDHRTKENVYDWSLIAAKDVGKYTGITLMEIKPMGTTLMGTLEDVMEFKLFEEMKRTRKSKAVTFIENYMAK